MSEKVKLPCELAEALDKSKHIGVVTLMEFLAHWEKHENATIELCTIHGYYLDNPYMIASALVNGYEVEPTPADKVRELYRVRSTEADQKETHGKTDDAAYYNGICRGINECLEALNIKIDGVNA